MTNKYMYFIANWKMFGDLRTLNSLDSVINFSKNKKKSKFRIIYCPPNTLIRPLSKRLKKTNLEVVKKYIEHSMLSKERARQNQEQTKKTTEAVEDKAKKEIKLDNRVAEFLGALAGDGFIGNYGRLLGKFK